MARSPLVVVLTGDVLMAMHSVDVQPTGSEPRLGDDELFEIVDRAVAKVEVSG